MCYSVSNVQRINTINKFILYQLLAFYYFLWLLVIGFYSDLISPSGARCSSVVRAFVRSWCDGSSDRSFIVEPLSYFSFQPMLQANVTKAVVCVILCGMMYIKEPLLLIGKSSLCGGSGFPLSLAE